MTTVAADGVVRVVLSGELARPVDAAVVARLTAMLDQRRPLLELDLSGVRFLDLAGWRVLVGLGQAAVAAGGRVRVVSASDAVRLLLELTDTASLFGYPPETKPSSELDAPG